MKHQRVYRKTLLVTYTLHQCPSKADQRSLANTFSSASPSWSNSTKLTEVGPVVLNLRVERQFSTCIGIICPMIGTQASSVHRIMQKSVVVHVERIQIASNCAAEKDWFLRYNSYLVSEGVEAKLGDIGAVNQNPAGQQPTAGHPRRPLLQLQ